MITAVPKLSGGISNTKVWAGDTTTAYIKTIQKCTALLLYSCKQEWRTKIFGHLDTVTDGQLADRILTTL